MAFHTVKSTLSNCREQENNNIQPK